MKWIFKAKDKDNHILRGILEASSKIQIQELLLLQDYQLQKCKVVKRVNKLFFLNNKLSLKELVKFLEEWKSLNETNLTTFDCLECINKSEKNKKIKTMITIIIIEIMRGKSISESFSLFPDSFPPLMINLLEIANNSSSFNIIIEHITEHYTHKKLIKDKVKITSLYPKILFILCGITITILTFFVIPSFSSLLKSFTSEMPKLSLLIISIFTFLKNNFISIIISIMCLILGYKVISKSKLVISIIEKIKLRIPFFNQIYKLNMTIRLVDNLNSLIQTGTTSIDALVLTKGLYKDTIYYKYLNEIEMRIKRGNMLGNSLATCPYFSEEVINIIEIGERSGNLKNIISYASKYGRNKYMTSITKITNLLEPSLILIVAVIIFMVIGAVFLPLFSIMNNIMGSV